jgi:hypothetical protein
MCAGSPIIGAPDHAVMPPDETAAAWALASGNNLVVATVWAVKRPACWRALGERRSGASGNVMLPQNAVYKAATKQAGGEYRSSAR